MSCINVYSTLAENRNLCPLISMVCYPVTESKTGVKFILM